MHGYPNFPYWILIALAKICFYHSHKQRKIPVVLVGKFLKKPKYLGPDLRCAERMCSNKRRIRSQNGIKNCLVNDRYPFLNFTLYQTLCCPSSMNFRKSAIKFGYMILII